MQISIAAELMRKGTGITCINMGGLTLKAMARSYCCRPSPPQAWPNLQNPDFTLQADPLLDSLVTSLRHV